MADHHWTGRFIPMNGLPSRFPAAGHPSRPGKHSLLGALADFDASRDASAYGRPRYQCKDGRDTIRLVIHLPDANPAAIAIELAGPDLMITAPKIRRTSSKSPFSDHPAADCGYQLRLRLGYHLDYEAVLTHMRTGVLTVTIPKKLPASAEKPV
jgi:HSP20 family molecular chaperone IbpA